MRWGSLVVALFLTLPSEVICQRSIDETSGFGVHLFPPELVMQHQRRIDLTADQRSTITTAVQELQARVVELQWQMQDETQRLADVLGETRVDSVAVLAQIDRVLEVEREIKRAHLAMLVRIKNTLTAEQQGILRQLRPREPSR